MEHLRTKGFQQLTTVEDAKQIFFDAIGGVKVRIDTVRIQKAIGRILAQEVIAGRYLPAVDLSALDGYAVRSNDIMSALLTQPVILEVVGKSRLGEACGLKVGPGQAIAVATGSCMPQGASSVVMVERTNRLQGNKVTVHSPATPGQGVTRKGEDFAPGRLVMNKGRRLRPEDIGALKALGLSKVQVVGRIRVGVLSTGNELVNSPTKKGHGKIVDVNRPIISAMVQELGAEPVDLGIARDEAGEIRKTLEKGLRSVDVVLVTAGSSVGIRDLVPTCINSIGKPGMLVHGVAMRPAMPTGLAVVKRKPIVSLPGFPVSAIFAFRVFVRPLLAKLANTPEPVDPSVRAVLKERITGAPNQRTFVRVRVKRVQAGFLAAPLKVQRSSLLTSMVDANGIVTIPEAIAVIEAGHEVDVTLTGDL